jgi:hypothetical protein
MTQVELPEAAAEARVVSGPGEVTMASGRFSHGVDILVAPPMQDSPGQAHPIAVHRHCRAVGLESCDNTVVRQLRRT